MTEIEILTSILEAIQDGKTTLYTIQRGRNNKTTWKYLKFAKKKGLIIQDTMGRTKPYKLTEEGLTFMRLMGVE